MNYINKIIELGFATGQGKGNEKFKELFGQKEMPEMPEMPEKYQNLNPNCDIFSQDVED